MKANNDSLEDEITCIFITIENYGTAEEARVDIRKLIKAKQLELLDRVEKYKHNIHPGFGECIPLQALDKLREEL